MFDIGAAYKKLADQVPLTEDEVVSLLKELTVMRKGVAYLASCQAATLESLPTSTSKSARRRHTAICQTAAELTAGNDTRIRYPQPLDVEGARCLKAVAQYGMAE